MRDRAAWGGPGEDYRLARIRGAEPGPRAPRVGRPAPAQQAPQWSVPRPARSVAWFEIVFIALGVASLGVSTAAIVATAGVASTARIALVALVPLATVIGLLLALDRWEPEPVWTRLVVLVWGAGVAALAASVVNQASVDDVTQATGDAQGALALVAVAVAPFVEELLKGLGVVLVVVWQRTSINSPLDGVVYAGYVGAGFAFVENVGYFLQAGGGGGSALTVTFVLRAVLSPFVHPMATSVTGFALGWAVTHRRSPQAWMWLGPLGWLGAVAVHATWNGIATFSGEVGTWFLYYLLVEVPLFVVWITVLLIASAREGRTVERGLVPYVYAGWMLPAEVPMAATRAGRRQARRWAARSGADARRAMVRFQRLAASLGLDQVLMERIGAQDARIERDRADLAALGAARATFLRASAGGGAAW